MPADGRVLQVNVSSGGVPKLPVPSARITRLGLEGDRQRESTVHGGPHRAVSLLGVEAIRRVASEGHPIAPGTTGENLTVEGFDVSAFPPGTRLAIGDEVLLELASPAGPCRTIRHSFRDLRFGRLSADAHPRDSRMYARVIREGTVRAGDAIRIEPAADDAAERHLVLDRLDAADRESSLVLWHAAARGGYDVHVVDDGEIAVVASRELPGPMFNAAIGFAHLPNLVDVALEHFRAHGVTGWIAAGAPPWPGAEPESTYGRFAASPGDVMSARVDGISVRELARDEIGTFGRVVVDAGGISGPAAEAYLALERDLALNAHFHRFVAEVDGRPVGAAALRTHHRLGWLRAASVLPGHRGRGIQRALVGVRAARAAALGCDLVGSSALVNSVSARNLAQCALRQVGVRHLYRYEPPG